MTRKTLSVSDAAAVLGVSRASAYRAVHRGQLEAIRIGRRLLVPRHALDRLLTGAKNTRSDATQAIGVPDES